MSSIKPGGGFKSDRRERQHKLRKVKTAGREPRQEIARQQPIVIRVTHPGVISLTEKGSLTPISRIGGRTTAGRGGVGL